MSSCFFLLRQFEDVNVYLSSIKAYLYNDDNFNWNYGVSLASVGKFKEAEECLLLVQNERCARVRATAFVSRAHGPGMWARARARAAIGPTTCT